MQTLTEELSKRGAPFVPVYTSRTFDSAPDTLAVLRALQSSSLAADGKVFFLQRSAMQEGKLLPLETVIAFAPFETLRSSQGRTQVQNSNGSTELNGNPFTALAERLAAYRMPEDIRIESFFGSALGYFAYDAVRFLEPTLTRKARNFARIAEQPAHCDAEFMFFRKRIVVDHKNHRILFASGVLNHENSQADALATAEAEVAEIETLFNTSQGAKTEFAVVINTDEEFLMDEMSSLLGRDNYLGAVRTLKKHIRDGDIFQAVLAEQLSTPFTKNPIDLFATLLAINPSPYEFYYNTGERVVLGSSPEMLLKIDGRKLQTHPIAGTRPTSTDPKADRRFAEQLLRSEKEKAEHLMLVDLARNDIGRVSEPGKVAVESFMQLKKFGSVMHLVSVVTGMLRKGLGPIEALAACFPAGTLSGAPKVRAMELLGEMEPQPRGFYGGAVVAASLNGDLDSCIAIRSVRIEAGTATAQAGAGIVADSKPENEYAEVTHKTRMVRRALAMVERA